MGLAKKVILANNLNIIVEAFFGSDIKNLSVTGTWYAVIIYAMQIYFDFSGYSDMAIGLGRIFGSDIRQKKKIWRTFSCLVLYGTLAWSKLELHNLGSFFRYVYFY